MGDETIHDEEAEEAEEEEEELTKASVPRSQKGHLRPSPRTVTDQGLSLFLSLQHNQGSTPSHIASSVSLGDGAPAAAHR